MRKKNQIREGIAGNVYGTGNYWNHSTDYLGTDLFFCKVDINSNCKTAVEF